LPGPAASRRRSFFFRLSAGSSAGAPNPLPLDPSAPMPPDPQSPAGARPCRVAVVEDIDGVRTELVRLLDSIEGFVCIQACASG